METSWLDLGSDPAMGLSQGTTPTSPRLDRHGGGGSSALVRRKHDSAEN